MWICDFISKNSRFQILKDFNFVTKFFMDALMHLPKEFWEEEMADMRKYLNEQVGKDTPNEVLKQIEEQEKRIASM